MKIFFGETFINKKDLEKAGINYPIKLEYYKQINEDYDGEFSKAKYGIEIIKKEYKPNNTRVKVKNIKYVTNDEEEEDRILNIFNTKQVTTINSEEVIVDLLNKGLQKNLN